MAALAWRLPTRNAAEAVLLVRWVVFTAFGVVLAGIDASVNRLPRPILAAGAAVVGASSGAARSRGAYLMAGAVIAKVLFP